MRPKLALLKNRLKDLRLLDEAVLVDRLIKLSLSQE